MAACTSQQGRSSAPVQLHGVLKSVSPVFMVPLDSKNRNRDPRGSVGFLAEISICKCEASCPCLSVDDLQYSYHVQKAFLYFVKPASLWRPVMAKLIGKVILVSGLKKKMVGVGGVRSYLMFVTTDKTNVSLCEVPLSMMASRVVRPVMNHARVYCGVVTGIYMQGMAVELDEKVWLMITDPLLGLHHSLRVGALVSYLFFKTFCLAVSFDNVICNSLFFILISGCQNVLLMMDWILIGKGNETPVDLTSLCSLFSLFLSLMVSFPVTCVFWK